MNIPNALTVLRILLTFAFIVFLFISGVAAKSIALALFILASITDILDGYIAKRTCQITDFGKMMDPIADKILVLSAFTAFVEMNIIPAWMLIIIVAREVTVTGWRLSAARRGTVMAAEMSGKHKTVWQMSVIFVILLYIILNEGATAYFGFWTERSADLCHKVILFMMTVVVMLTLASGIGYLTKTQGGEKA